MYLGLKIFSVMLFLAYTLVMPLGQYRLPVSTLSIMIQHQEW